MEEVLEPFCHNKTLDELENCTKWLNMNRTGEAYSSGPEAVIVPLCFGVVFVIGLIGNLFLLYYVLRKRRLNTPHNCYVVNLAAGDVLMITVSLPFISTIYTATEWPFGETICKLSEFVQTLCTAVTIFSITALSIERYLILSVVEPSGRNKMTLVAIVLIWIFALILAIPDLVSATIITGGDLEFCVLYRPTWTEAYAQALTVVKLVFLFVLPLLVLAPFYLLIVLTLMNSDQSGHLNHSNGTVPLNSESNTSHDFGRKMDKQRRIVAILVMSLVCLFIICWLPRHVFLIWFHFIPGDFNHFWHVFKITGFCLMFANSGVNPLAFLLFDPGFRHFVMSCDWCKSTSYNRPEVFEDFTSGPKQTIVLTEMAHDPKNSSEV